MKMTKYFILFCLCTMIVGCKEEDNNIKEIEKLTQERDSLKAIVDTLKTKYVFDEASLTSIPVLWKKHSSGKVIALVGYVAFNKDDKILFSTQSNFKNADTLTEKSNFEFTVERSNVDTVYYKLINRPKFGKVIDYTVSDPLKNYP